MFALHAACCSCFADVCLSTYLPSLYFTFDPGLTVTVNFIFTLREPNVYKPHGFFLGFLDTFICFCGTVLFYRYLYFVVNQIKLQSIETRYILNCPGEVDVKRINATFCHKDLLKALVTLSI